MLYVRLLGQFNLRLDDRELLITSRPAQALLAYLVLNRAPHRREKLSGLLWPDTGEANARRNLRQALWQLRRALGGGEAGMPEYILADELTVAFAAQAPYTLDVSLLEGAADPGCSTAELITAAAAYAGELLPGFYDDWAVLERERLEGVFDQCAQALVTRLMGEERWEDAIAWALRWIATGHVPEPAYRALMIAYSRLGDGAGAATAFLRCRQALQDELGVEPSAQTMKLYELLRAGRTLPIPGIPAQPATETARSQTPPSVEAVPEPGEPPFKGMPYFDEDDAGIFFGREELTARLVERLRGRPSVVALVGASGSGKSSIVRAGLVPAMRAAQGPDGRPDWLVCIITPTSQPAETLAVSLSRAGLPVSATAALMDDLARDERTLRVAARRLLAESPRPAPRGLLLVVDQFEELFTLCRDEASRRAFVDNLLAAARPPAGDSDRGPAGWSAGVALVIALRADFYSHCSQYAGLRALLSAHQEYIGPMNAAELRRAIEAPAARHGWSLEPGLVDLMLRDVGDEPGALPLLSHALLETWRRRRGRTLTLAGYAEAGGVRGAIAKAAERAYQGMTPEEQAAARAIFLRLAEVGEWDLATRRRVPLRELVPATGAAPGYEAVLETLADARLITLGAGTVEVAHEALIREWPALRAWLAEDREGLALHRRLTEAAGAWDSLGRDPGELYRGARLAQAAEWAASHTASLNSLEEAFLAASGAQAEGEALEREQTRQRELVAAQALAATQREGARRLRRRALWLSGALALAAILALLALLSGRQAIVSARSAEGATRIARAREWAAAARNSLDADPERSVLLALQAVAETYRPDHAALPEAQEALHRALTASHIRATLLGHSGAVTGAAYSPDGLHLVTVGADGGLKLWGAASGRLERSFTAHPYSAALGVAFSPDGARVATVGRVDGVRIWDVAAGKELMALGSDSTGMGLALTNSVAFSPDGNLVAAGRDDGTVRVWDAATGADRLTLRGDGDEEQVGAVSVAFSPDGRLLATARPGRRGSAPGYVYELSTGRRVLTLSGVQAGLNGIVFSRDGSRLAGAGEDHTARIWDAASGALLSTLSGHTGEVTAVAFSPDGSRLATASLDGTARVWDLAAHVQIMTFAGHVGAVDAVAFAPDAAGAALVTGGVDGTARIWDVTPDRELFDLSPAGPENGVGSIAFAALPGSEPARMRFAAGSQAGTTSLWLLNAWSAGGVLAPPPQLQTVLDPAPGSTAGDARAPRVALSPDGRRLAVSGASAGPSAVISDAGSGKTLLALDDPGGPAIALAFSGNGSVLITANGNREARVWDASTGQQLQVLAGHSAGITAVAANFDGSRLATASEDGEVMVWDGGTGTPIYSLNTAGTSIAPGVPAGPGAGQPALREGGAGVWTLAFSPDGRLLATGGQDNRARVWEVASHQLLVTLSGHTAGVRGVAFSPDGALLATASDDTSAKVWDLSTGAELYTLVGHTDVVTGVAFSPDGKELATAGADGTIRFYLVRIEDLVALARARVTRGLTGAECRQHLHLEITEVCPGKP